jgi:hypothetical protein
VPSCESTIDSAFSSNALAYGPTSIEALDLYASKAPNAPINIFVHGGAWGSELAKDQAAHAEVLVNAGAHLAVLDFNNVIETGGNLMIMADQVRRGVRWVYQNAKSLGGDPERIYISGHSSGGHWVGVLLTTDWQRDFGLPPNMIKGGVAGSGMFVPLRLGAYVFWPGLLSPRVVASPVSPPRAATFSSQPSNTRAPPRIDASPRRSPAPERWFG